MILFVVWTCSQPYRNVATIVFSSNLNYKFFIPSLYFNLGSSYKVSAHCLIPLVYVIRIPVFFKQLICRDRALQPRNFLLFNV